MSKFYEKKGIHSIIYASPIWLRVIIYGFYGFIAWMGAIAFLSLFFVHDIDPNYFNVVAIALAIVYISIIEIYIRTIRWSRGWNASKNLFSMPERNLKHDIDVCFDDKKDIKDV